jgi:peptidoglycan/xylan/chitin deacetylase (PgdA/CDA1 family)
MFMILRSLVHRFALLTALLVVISWGSSYAAEVVYIGKSGETSFLEKQTQVSAAFYGLQENIIALTGNRGGSERVIEAIQNSNTVAIVISADTLPFLDRARILAKLEQRQKRQIPVLLGGIDENTEPSLLKQWSDGAITAGKRWTIESKSGFYHIESVNGVTYELSGNKLPLNASELGYLLPGNKQPELIMSGSDGGAALPVFARVNVGTRELFFAAATPPSRVPVSADPYREPLVFASLAPEMIFLRHAAGERAWHSPGHYANLTIDDAWLREPYGYVNYENLLSEMDRHNFHTTVAFVPWNYDRSQPAMVSLFRAHEDRFSICIHGDNHDHQEFGSYAETPLNWQVHDIKQAVARMAKFHELTHIPYDPVMVFPHSISPEPTFGALKRYNFWATANSLNVPMGSEAPSDPDFALRAATLNFANFPSLRRYSAEAPGPPAQLVVDAFLGNPMLFYVHQAFFAPGIDAFDKTADTVNQIEPATEWRNLGFIAQHLYVEKLRDDGDYDVRAYTSSMRLKNSSAKAATFYIAKPEDFALPLGIEVDGQRFPYQRAGNELRVAVSIRAGQTRQIEVTYQNDLNLAAIDISKSSVRIFAIRQLSDFRDDVVSKSALGRGFIRLYVWQEDRGNGLLLILSVLLSLALLTQLVRRGKRRRKSPQTPYPAASSGARSK